MRIICFDNLLKRTLWISFLLILIATILASYLIYLQTQTNYGPAIVEQYIIRNVEFVSNNSAIVTVQNTGGDSQVYQVVFVSAKINGINASIVQSGFPAGVPNGGATANFKVTLCNENHFLPENTYKFQLRTLKGTVADYQTTYHKTT